MSNGFGYKKGAFGKVLSLPHDDFCVEANGGTVRPSGMETIAFDENVAKAGKRDDVTASAVDEHAPDWLSAVDQSEFSRINRNGSRRESEMG